MFLILSQPKAEIPSSYLFSINKILFSLNKIFKSTKVCCSQNLSCDIYYIACSASILSKLTCKTTC